MHSLLFGFLFVIRVIMSCLHMWLGGLCYPRQTFFAPSPWYYTPNPRPKEIRLEFHKEMLCYEKNDFM